MLDGWMGVGGAPTQSASGELKFLDRSLFTDILSDAQHSTTGRHATKTGSGGRIGMATDLHISPDARQELHRIVDTNILILFGKIRTERRRTVSRKGAPVGVQLVRTALSLTPFTIPC
jgi:hypothetical protein